MFYNKINNDNNDFNSTEKINTIADDNDDSW